MACSSRNNGQNRLPKWTVCKSLVWGENFYCKILLHSSEQWSKPQLFELYRATHLHGDSSKPLWGFLLTSIMECHNGFDYCSSHLSCRRPEIDHCFFTSKLYWFTSSRGFSGIRGGSIPSDFFLVVNIVIRTIVSRLLDLDLPIFVCKICAKIHPRNPPKGRHFIYLEGPGYNS